MYIYIYIYIHIYIFIYIYINLVHLFVRKIRSMPPNGSSSLLRYVNVSQSKRKLEAFMGTYMVSFDGVNVMKYGALSFFACLNRNRHRY